MINGKWFFLAGLLPFLNVAAAEKAVPPPPEIPAPATELMIFRSGEAVIRREADPKGRNTFSVTGNFAPLEGTLWVSGNVFQVRRFLSRVEKKQPVPLSDITATYRNQPVTLLVTDEREKVVKVSGTVLDLYAQRENDLERAGVSIIRDQTVTLKCSDGRLLNLSRHRIVGVESASLKIGERTVRKERQAWEFTMLPGKSGRVVFDYISRTLSWSPALKMTLLPERKMRLDFAATVANSGDDMEKVKCTLWAGSPNLVNAGKISPMAIVKFLPPMPPVNAPMSGMRKYRSFSNAVAMDRMAAEEYTPAAPGLSANMAPFDAGVLTLKKGEALVRQLGTAPGKFENLVRWRIPARQNDSGSRVWIVNPDVNNKLWECLSFVNPFKYAIPDCAVEIADGSRVLAQVSGEWVNPGETATLEIARCRDVKGTLTEKEAPSSIKNRGEGFFQQVMTPAVPPRGRAGGAVGLYNGVWFRVTDIEGTLTLKNFRKESVKLLIEMDYFGEFVSASGKPEKKLIGHVATINPKNQLRWELEMKPGEDRKLTFRYNVILNR